MALKSHLYSCCTLALRDDAKDRAMCIYTFDSSTTARLTSIPCINAIKKDAIKLGYPQVCIYEFGEKEPFRISTKTMTSQQPQIITPAFFASAGWVTPTLWQRFGKLLEMPETKKGISRASDRRQLYVTQAAASVIKTTAQEAAQRKATDYIYLPDLEEIDQIINQDGSQPDGVTIRYRATLNGTSNTDPNAVWGWFTAQTHLFEDEAHIFYRESEILDIREAVSPPLLVNA